MKRLIAVWFLLCSGCGQPAPMTTTASTPARGAHVEQATGEGEAEAAPSDCGSFQISLEDPCTEGRARAQRCIVDAMSACRTATLRRDSTTDEGGRVVSTYSVRPASSGCELLLVTDWTGDPYGPAPHSHQRCRQLSADDNAAGCQTLVHDECDDDQHGLPPDDR